MTEYIKDKKTDQRYILFVVVILCLLALYFMRIINLDQDLPSWGIANYQPKDEGAYSIMAISQYEYGSVDPYFPIGNDTDSRMYIPEQLRPNIIENILVYLGLKDLGDNYYGLRIPIVVIGFISILLMLYTMFQLYKQYGNKTGYDLWIIAVLLALTVFDFYFYIASRTVEPSTMRMLFIQLIILIWIQNKISYDLKFFLLGACVTMSVVFVYFSNCFLYLAFGVLLLFFWKNEGLKKFCRYTGLFIIGSAIVFAASCYVYHKIWNSSPIKDFLSAINLFSNIQGYQITASKTNIIFGAVKGFVKYFSSNIFLYMPALLALVLCVFPLAIHFSIIEKDYTLMLLWLVPCSFLIQTMVTEDYIWRKAILILPCCLYLIYWCLLARNKITNWVANVSGKKYTIGKKKEIGGKSIILAFLIAVVLAVTFSLAFHLKISNDWSKFDIDKVNRILILTIGYLPLLLAYIIVIRKLKQGKFVCTMKAALYVLGFSSFLLNVMLLIYNVWLNPNFKEKKVMQSLSSEYKLDGKYIIGDYVCGITLYNDIKPIFDYSQNYEKQLVNNPELLLFHYSEDEAGFASYLDNDIFSKYTPYTALQINEIPGVIQINGKLKNFALYKAATRQSVYKTRREKYLSLIDEVEKKIADLDMNRTSKIDVTQKNILKKDLLDKLDKYKGVLNIQQVDINTTILNPVYSDIHGDVKGDIQSNIQGNVYGDIYGSVYGDIYGNVYGDIYGDLYGNIHGSVFGKLKGKQIGTMMGENK